MASNLRIIPNLSVFHHLHCHYPLVKPPSFLVQTTVVVPNWSFSFRCLCRLAASMNFKRYQSNQIISPSHQNTLLLDENWSFYYGQEAYMITCLGSYPPLLYLLLCLLPSSLTLLSPVDSVCQVSFCLRAFAFINTISCTWNALLHLRHGSFPSGLYLD